MRAAIITPAIILALFFFHAGKMPNERVSTTRAMPVEQRVGEGEASTTFSYFNTSPESPDGKMIAYIRCKAEPTPQKARVPASLWVCDRDLKHHREVTGIERISVHDGAEAQWVDNTRLALFDNMRVRLIDIQSGKDLITKKLMAAEMGHQPFNGKVLYSICEGKVPGEPAIYELDCNTQQVRTVFRVKDLESFSIPSYMNKDSLYPVMKWQLSHLQYSPDGKKICFRIELGPKDNTILLGICNVDGSGLKIWMKPLHFLWYDNESIIGHLSNEPDGEKPDPPVRRYSLTRWDLDGKVVEAMMAPRGNHLALSPDLNYFVSESFYKTNPVIVNLYQKNHAKAPVEICRFDPKSLTWEEKFHVNPSFSRDGKRVYYSRPLNDKYNGTFFIDIK